MALLSRRETIQSNGKADMKMDYLGYRYWLARAEASTPTPVSVYRLKLGMWIKVHGYGSWRVWRELRGGDS